MAGRTFPNLASTLKPGRNVLAIRGENASGPKGRNPAGLSAWLEIEFKDGSKQKVSSDDSWRAAKEEAAGWQATEFKDSNWKTA